MIILPPPPLRQFKEFILIILGSVVLLNLAFYNGYPLVYSDTGTYIRSGMMNWIPVDRPIFYGYFIKYSSLGISLWYVVWMQSLIFSYLIFRFVGTFWKTSKLYFYFLVSIFMLAILTGATFNVSMLTADIFTSFIYLVIILLIFNKSIGKIEYLFLCILLLFSIITHNSHVLISGLAMLFMLCLLFIFKWIGKQEIEKLSAYLRIGIIIIISIVLLPSFNYLIDGKFRISDSTHIFLMHKLHDDNILVKYLNENCRLQNNFLCEFKDSLPWDIIWDPNSPLTKDGDWSKYKKECDQLIFDMLTTYRYSKLFFLKAIHQTLTQFFNFNTGDIPTSDMLLEPPTSAINEHFKLDIREYLSSRIYNKKLTFERINTIQYFVAYFSLILLLLYLFILKSDRNNPAKMVILVLFLFMLSNAFVCATFSNVLERYQSRLIFLLPLVAIMVLPEMLKVLAHRVNMAVQKPR